MSFNGILLQFSTNMIKLPESIRGGAALCPTETTGRLRYRSAPGRIRRKIADEHCHCTYECFLTNAVMFNPALFGKVLAEAVRIKFHRWFPGGS